MTLQESEMTEEEVMSVRDRSLVEAYEDHDVGMAYLKARLAAHGFVIEDHGDDARHADEVYFGDGPDLAIYHSDADEKPAAYIELKVKTSQEWFARCNRRHFNEYVNFTNGVDAPVFIWFALIDSDTDQLCRAAFFEVKDTDQLDGELVDVSSGEIAFPMDAVEPTQNDGSGELFGVIDGNDVVDVRGKDAITGFIPNVHGNDVVCLNENELRSMPYFLRRIE